MDNNFKLIYRKLQKEYSQLKNEWLPIVWVHAQSIEKEVKGYEEQIKHFLGVK